MDRFADAGFAAVSFNFSLNGVSEDSPMDFTGLDKFAQNTFSQELEDLGCVIDYIYQNAEDYNIDKNRIGLIGHSRGGGITILKGFEDNRVKAIATWASVSTFNRYTNKQKIIWREKGFMEVENTRTKQMMKLKVTLLEDIENNPDRLDIKKAISSLNKPALIIHGKEDLAVKVDSVNELYEVSNKDLTTLSIIENTGHTFGVVHPFKGTTKAFDRVIDETIGFMKKSLF